MAGENAFTITRVISRDELERHQKRFIGITVTAPQLKEINGGLEYACDVRIGVHRGWGLVKDCVVSQWAVGAVTDMNVPVLCERSEAGLVTVIARSVVRLPDISYSTYSYADLGLVFMTGLEQDADSAGAWRDGFGYAMPDPTAETGETTTWTWDQQMVEWGSSAFQYGVTQLGASTSGWEET